MILSGERVDLWTTNESDKRWVAQAEASLHSAEARAGWVVAPRIRLMIFPSVETFRDATGDSGIVLASTRGTLIRAQPSLDAATVRHEIWHAVIESKVPSTVPHWFREGLALEMSELEPRSLERASARDRVRSLIARFGEKEVLGWAHGKPAPAGVLGK
jgi:stage II sporulation protein D